MSLYQKHRPTSLKNLIGNVQVVRSLESMLQIEKQRPHVYLLHGPKGCGKTTLARIIAKELGAKGADFKEMDTADFRGVDVIREIRKQAHFRPMESPCRVWVLDECHKLTNDAQSAMLKILEDTPDHVYFVLCTTDPQKLLPTVRSRCTQFQVEPLTDVQMKKLLVRTAKKEGEKLGRSVVEQIIQDSLGHPRDALQILDKVLRVEPKMRRKVAMQAADKQNQSIELCRALLKGEPWKKIQNILDGLKTEEAEQVRRHVLGYCQAVLLKSDNERAGLIMEEFIEPFYDSGFPGLVLASYTVVKN